MAQIVTITNPLTGQPTQVDQLEHTAQQIDDAIARAIPGGAIDSALENKAPAGYGLGGGYQRISDANSITIDGKYATDDSTLNLPVSGMFGVLEVSVYRYDKSITQLFRPGTNGWQPYSFERHCINGIWLEWAWVNPPMGLGVEYRTTERHCGKPVYVKLVDFGALPNASTKTVTWGDGTTKAFELSACAIVGEQYYTLPIDNQAIAWVGAANVSIKTTSNYSGWTAYALIKYTKTTD